MQFRLLGPVEAVREDLPLPLGGAKPRALLALLLIYANEVVSRDRLIDALWPEREPGAAAHSLDVQVSRLRKAFAPEEPLVTRSGGYVLELDPEAIDAVRFEHSLEQGRRANAEGKPSDALAALEAALSLWRGNAFADLAYEEFARAEAERLEELRLVATEERIDAELALGRHSAVIPELETLVGEHPLRERPREQLMLALYRSGRQADALRVYGDARRWLVDELGIEPGAGLRNMEQAILRQDPALDPPRSPATTRRRRIAVGAVALAAAGVAAAAVVMVTQGGTENAHALAEPDSNVLLSAETGDLVRTIPVSETAWVRFDGNALWSLSEDGLLTRLDPATGETVATIGLGVEPAGLAIGEGSVWVTGRHSPTLFRIDPSVNAVVDRIPLPMNGVETDGTGEVAVGAGSVWVGHGAFNPGAWVERIDPNTAKVTSRFSILAGDADHLAFGEGALWVASTPSGELRKIDPRTDRPVFMRKLQSDLCCVAVGGGFVWAGSNPEGVVWKVTPDGVVLPTITLSAPIKRLRYANGALWAALGETGTVMRIDPTTGEKRTYEIGHSVSGVDVRNELVAAAVRPGPDDQRQTIESVVGDLGGDVVWVGRKADTFFDSGAPIEPAWTGPTWDVPQVQFHFATCARLLNYRDAEGEAGRKLVPEVAADLPKVTDNGRTYRFTIRDGFGFSPPSNEQVTAESFRHAAERAMSANIDANPDDLLPPTLANIVGAEAYHAGKASHISGIAADRDELVIHLRKPAPELPWFAALTCAVPVDTPIVPDGIKTPVASAGPYYLAALTDSFAVLKRNPNYGGSRPQRLDAIVFRFNVPPAEAVTEIENGTLDYFLESQNPTLAANTAAARAAGPRYRITPDGASSTRFLFLNTSRPLFADINMRRAVQYAIDRTALAKTDGLPATRLYSPMSPGYDATPLYPLRPDIRTARRLTGGRKAHAVLLAFDPTLDPVSAAFVRAVRDQLAAVGISVSVLPMTNRDFANGGAGFLAKAARSDLGWAGINGHTADPVDYLQPLYLPPKERNELERIATLASPERERAAVSLTNRIERKSLYAVFSYSGVPELVSRRLSCVVHQPEYAGVDLSALCLKGSD
jgi:DNA-binding SARP family transcriptional activator/ABC-type transport system substrate-binding protein